MLRHGARGRRVGKRRHSIRLRRRLRGVRRQIAGGRCNAEAWINATRALEDESELTIDDRLTALLPRIWLTRMELEASGNTPAGEKPSLPEELRERVRERIAWAGEAVAPAYDPDYQPLAMHGAYVTGVRAARDVAHYLNDARGDARKFKRYYRGVYGG